MRGRFVLSAFVAFLICLLAIAQTETPPFVVIEATSSLSHSLGYCEDHLLVRLTSDGKVEWEAAGQLEKCGKSVGDRPKELHSTRVGMEQVSAVTQRLDEIDPEAIQPRMGPYNRYVDTSVELLIRIGTPKWNHQFSVINPWPYYQIKPLPKELKTVICEIDRLHAQVTGEPAEPMCVENAPAAMRQQPRAGSNH